MLHPTEPVLRLRSAVPGQASVLDDPPSSAPGSGLARPLCVMVDGTLFHADPSQEAWLRGLRRAPSQAIGWLLRSVRRPQAVWTRLWREVGDALGRLPHDPRVLQWIRQQRNSGRRRIVLCIDAPAAAARRVAARFPEFDEVLAFERTDERSPEGRRARLTGEYGQVGYDLLAARGEDLPALQAAHTAYLTGGGQALRHRLQQADATTIAPERRQRLRAWLRALRLRQWSKNLLLFVPAAAAHSLGDPLAVLQCLAGFLFFGLCASGTYLVNDLLDIDADRQHLRKRARPFAAGDLPAGQGIKVAPVLIAASLIGSSLVLAPWFVACLAGYVVATFWYSLSLKSRAMVDVFVLAGLYTLRLLAGAAAIGIVPSFWLLAFSMFLFFSLAMVKRYTEMRARLRAGSEHAPGRGYSTDDLPLLLVFGAGGGLLAVLVLALYIDIGAPAIYPAPHFLWLTCPLLLYWVGRVWLKAHRGTMHDDPVVFALSDRPSLAVLSLFGGCAWLATRRDLPEWLSIVY